MGGIAGIICSHPVAEDGIRAIIEKMLKSILHRGPDERGFASLPYGGMGHQRLIINDPRGGQQPFYHPEKPYILVFDGEIYNYQALREKLESKGVEFQTRSDTEVLMMMYDYYDEDMFNYLEGMYAFALWNGEKKELIIAKDPLGEKPIYYEMDEHGIAFASELKAILQARQSKPSLNEVAVQNYLALQYIPSPMTMFQGIFKLPPGYMLRWRIADESLEVWPIWVPDDDVSKYWIQNENISVDNAIKELHTRLNHSMELRMKTSEVPIGMFLSGGLNSSLITALAKNYTSTPLHTFSVGYAYNKKGMDERIHARKVSQILGTVHHEVEIGPSVFEELPRILWHLDEPLADPSLLTTDALAKAASTEFKVIMTGQGGDEIFAGYPKYGQYQRLLQVNKIPAPMRKIMAMLTKGLPVSTLGWEKYQILKGILSNSDSLAILQTYSNFPEDERRKLLKTGSIIPDRRFRVYSKGAFDPFVQIQWDDLHHWLPHNLLMGLDKVTMGYNIEARCPFMDHNLVSWAIGLPERLKWKKSTSKYLLREYAKNYLSADIIKPRSRGYSMPLDTWLYTTWEVLGHDFLGSALFTETSVFKLPYVEKLLRQYEAGTLKSAQPVWNLLVLKIWYDVFTKCNSKDDLWELQGATRGSW